MEKLITLEMFIDRQKKIILEKEKGKLSEDTFSFSWKVIKYNKFLQTKPEPWMFIKTDESSKENPVLFDYFEVVETNLSKYSKRISYKEHNGFTVFWFNIGKNEWELSKNIRQIKDILNFPEFTKEAKQFIFG